MKNTLLILWALLALVGIAHDAPKTALDSTEPINKTSRAKGSFGYMNCFMISAGIDKGNAYEKDKYIACEAVGNYDYTFNELYLSGPFILEKYPWRIHKGCFFYGTVNVESGYSDAEGPDGALFAETITKSPVWNTNSEEELNLDYHIYLLPLKNGHDIDKQLEISYEKVFKTELVFFSPYFEKDGYSYVLTWNPDESVPDSSTVKDGMLFFPFRDEPGTHLGAVISPVLNFNKTTSKSLILYGKVGNSTLWCVLSLTGKDDKGKTWVLSWKRVKKDELQNSGQYSIYSQISSYNFRLDR